MVFAYQIIRLSVQKSEGLSASVSDWTSKTTTCPSRCPTGSLTPSHHRRQRERNYSNDPVVPNGIPQKEKRISVCRRQQVSIGLKGQPGELVGMCVVLEWLPPDRPFSAAVDIRKSSATAESGTRCPRVCLQFLGRQISNVGVSEFRHRSVKLHKVCSTIALSL